jgi:GTPase SAR1 family protein
MWFLRTFNVTVWIMITYVTWQPRVVYCYLLLDIWRTIGQIEIRARNIQRNLKSHTRAIVYSISMFTIVNKNNNSMFTKASPTKLASQIKVNVCVLKDKQALFFIYESPCFKHQFFMAQFILVFTKSISA